MNNFCPRCGAQLVAGSNLCYNCGNNSVITTQTNQTQTVYTGTGRLTLHRKKGFVGSAVSVHISINGVSYELKNNNQIILDLAPGSYQINYKVWCRREQSLIVNIQAGGNYFVNFVYDPVWGGFKIGKDSILN